MNRRVGVKDRILSSLPLQMMLYFNQYYSYLFFVLEIIILIWKSLVLPYPPQYIGMDFALLFIFLCSDFIRIYLGSRGNKTQQKAPLFVFIFLCGGLVALHVYFYLYQVFVLRIEQIINIISIVFNGVEFFLAILSIVAFASMESV